MANLIDLKSSRGQAILEEVQKNKAYFQPNLYKIFEKQKGNKNCGIQSSSLLLNSAHIGSDKFNTHNDLPYTEEKMFTFQETLKITNQNKIQDLGGLTLEEVYQILKSHGHDVEMFHASDSSVDEFRSQIKEYLSSETSATGMIVNYHMGTLGQGMWFGHHSPLCGYTNTDDMALIMDTWHATQECWAKLEDIYNAMNTEDSASGKTRGFITFKYNSL